MFKKTVFIILAISIFLTGCGEPTPLNKDTSTSSQTEIRFGEIALKTTPQHMFGQLNNMGIQIDMPDYTEYPIPKDAPNAVEDGRIYNMTDLSFYYKAKDLDLYFSFSSEGSLSTITNWDKNVLSAEGLVIGSSLETAKNIYGLDYTENPGGAFLIQYSKNEEYFNVFYENNTITGWSLSKYSNINND